MPTTPDIVQKPWNQCRVLLDLAWRSSIWAVLTVLGCKPTAGEPCKMGERESCADGSICASVGDRTRWTCMTQGEADAKCEKERDCKTLGRCGYAFSCAPTKKAHCEGSDACKQEGHCSIDPGGACAAVNDVDCKNARACIERKQCAASLGVCTVDPGDDDDIDD
jgi:hypothetical protein